jgi:hypothetical protein
MIELELRGFSQGREGLLIEVGRFILATGLRGSTPWMTD